MGDIVLVDEMEWCMYRGAYLKNKKVLRNIEYDDMIDIFGKPSRIYEMMNNSTSLSSDKVITYFEKDKKYHIEWHCRIEDRYFMIMGFGIDNNNKEWIIYYSDDSKEDIDNMCL